MRRTNLRKSDNVTVQKLTIKDHKKVNVGELPATRVMVPSHKSMTNPLNNILADVVELAANARTENSVEINSCEHLLNKLDRYNQGVENDDVRGQVMMLGTDVVSLFGNMG